MPGVVLLASSNDPDDDRRVREIARALAAHTAPPTTLTAAHLGAALTGVVHAPTEADAARALDALAAARPGRLVVECHSPGALAAAARWRHASHADAVLLAGPAALSLPDLPALADGAIVPTRAHARRAEQLGLRAARVLIVPDPVHAGAELPPGDESVLCLTPLAPGRGLIELLDAWAASGAGETGTWTLRLAGPALDAEFALHLAARTASCAGVVISERCACPEAEAARCAVLIDPHAEAPAPTLAAVACARAIFAPTDSPTAEIACPAGSLFAYPTGRGVRGLIETFEVIAAHRAADFVEPGRAARARVLTACDPRRSARARQDAHAAAAGWPVGRGVPPAASSPWPAPSPAGPDQSARLERAMLACVSRGLRRVALYGCGGFARACAHALREPPVEVVGFMDDDDRSLQGRRLWGYPVLCPAVALTGDLDAVILTAPSAEEVLWERSAGFRRAGIRVISLTRHRVEHALPDAA